MDPDSRKTLLFAFSWAFRWYQASMGWESSWLVLAVWVATWWAKKNKHQLSDWYRMGRERCAK